MTYPVQAKYSIIGQRFIENGRCQLLVAIDQCSDILLKTSQELLQDQATLSRFSPEHFLLIHRIAIEERMRRPSL